MAATNDDERGTTAWNMTNHRPTAAGIELIERFRGEFIALAEQVESRCPPSRERSLAITKLEEAVFWTVASIARTETDD